MAGGRGTMGHPACPTLPAHHSALPAPAGLHEDRAADAGTGARSGRMRGQAEVGVS